MYLVAHTEGAGKARVTPSIENATQSRSDTAASTCMAERWYSQLGFYAKHPRWFSALWQPQRDVFPRDGSARNLRWC